MITPTYDTTKCYHCGLPIPRNAHFSVTIDHHRRPMCCAGCEAVAQAIVDNGLTDFYQHRTQSAPTGEELVPEFLRKAQSYDHPAVQKSFVQQHPERPGAVCEASLILEGITCAACVWLNERHLSALPGVLEVSINYATHRARILWDNDKIKLSQILEAIHAIGYHAHPYDPSHAERLIENERREQLKRLGLAGILGMQVMMLAVGLYIGDWRGMEPNFRLFLRAVSLLLTTPILFFAARPFFLAAWRDLKRKQAGMDVPVSLGISIAFAGSLWATFTDSGHVYYDSVAMFVFFLLTARYFELAARKRATLASQALVHAVPALAYRIQNDGSEKQITVAELSVGDRVRVRPGESVPADGVILSGESSLDESLLTGESRPISKKVGADVVGGSINSHSPLEIEITRTGTDTVLAAILRLLERAQSEKPALAQLADRIASVFVLAVLLLAIVVGIYWFSTAPDSWLAITISLLVVTCPCALSLATPTALSAATGNLTRLGLLATRGHALETLARATHIAFDKTGTLTEGKLKLTQIETIAPTTQDAALALAAALEIQSEHPIGRALVAEAHARSLELAISYEIKSTSGAGIEGKISGADYVLGNAAFIHLRTSHKIDDAVQSRLEASGDTIVWLANHNGPIAAFSLGDRIRPGAAELIRKLKTDGRQVVLLTGDQMVAAQRVATTLGIDTVHAGLDPAGKLAALNALSSTGAIVAMLGDGVNDAPVLGAAHVSIAMGSGTHIAAASADMILLSDNLEHIGMGIKLSRKTLAIIRQNLAWALVYNASALPLAATGFIAPWMAAIGMSASSLIVVANAMRLTLTEPNHSKPEQN